MAHIIEEAKSGRAGCRTCKKPIGKGELRFGEETENQFSDSGDTTHRWHHLNCAATSKPDELRTVINDYPSVTAERKVELEKLMTEADAKKPPPFPYADKAPTGRAKCIGCGETIAKAEIRVAIERDIERGMTTTKGAGYLHPKCSAAYVEQNGSSHDELCNSLKAHTRGLSEDEMGKLFSEV